MFLFSISSVFAHFSRSSLVCPGGSCPANSPSMAFRRTLISNIFSSVGIGEEYVSVLSFASKFPFLAVALSPTLEASVCSGVPGGGG